MVVEWIATIGTVFMSIWSGIKEVVSVVANVVIAIVRTILDWFKALFDWFIKTAPRWLQVLVFLFIVLFLLNGILGFFLNLTFVCTSSNQLKKPVSIISSIEILFTKVFTNVDNSTISWDNFIENRTYEQVLYKDPKSAESMMRVECINQNPRLTFFGLDFLNYRFWVLLILIGALLKVLEYLKKK